MSLSDSLRGSYIGRRAKQSSDGRRQCVEHHSICGAIDFQIPASLRSIAVSIGSAVYFGYFISLGRRVRPSTLWLDVIRCD